MELTINGEKTTVDGVALSVSDLLKTQNVDMPDMVSVELNGAILDRSEFDSKQVANGDQVEFLYFMGGGQNLNALAAKGRIWRCQADRISSQGAYAKWSEKSECASGQRADLALPGRPRFISTSACEVE